MCTAHSLRQFDNGTIITDLITVKSARDAVVLALLDFADQVFLPQLYVTSREDSSTLLAQNRSIHIEPVSIPMPNTLLGS